MEDILKLDTINRGGVRRVEIIFEDDIVALPINSPASLYAEGSMSIAPGARPYFLYFTHKSSVFEEKGNIKNRAGDYSIQSIKLRSPKDRPLLRDFICRLENSEVAIVYLDWNGYWKILRRMRCMIDITTNVFGQYNGATFQFTSKSNIRSQFWRWTEYPYVHVDPITNQVTPVDDFGSGVQVGGGSNSGGGQTGGNTGGGSFSSDSCIDTFTHDQAAAASTWIINHDLGEEVFRPRLKNSAGDDLEAEGLVSRIWYKDDNSMEIDFTSPQSGSAYLFGFGNCTPGASGDCCCDGERVDFNNFYEITIPAEKKLTSIEVWTSLNKTVSVGTINGSGNIIDNESILANIPTTLDLGLFYLTQKKIYVSGSGAFKMKYYIAGCADGSDSCCEGIKFSGNGSIPITIPAEGKLTSIEFWAAADALVNVGDSIGGNEYVEDAEFEIIEEVLSLELGIFSLQEKTIYISAPGDFTIKYYLK